MLERQPEGIAGAASNTDGALQCMWIKTTPLRHFAPGRMYAGAAGSKSRHLYRRLIG